MHTITFKCKTVTPLFMGGADGKTPELRPPGIKAALRFWWRAVHGGMSLEELKQHEAKVFGATSTGRSRFSVQVRNSTSKISNSKLELNKRDYPGINYLFYSAMSVNNLSYYQPDNAFDLHLGFRDIESTDFDEVLKAILAFNLFGSVGTRARRGAGGIAINGQKFGNQNKLAILDMRNIQDTAALKAYYETAKTFLNPKGNRNYSTLGGARVYFFRPQSTWEDALESIGKPFQAFRGEHQSEISDTPNFGFPILHRNQKTTMLAGKSSEHKASLQRRASPLLFKILQTGESLYFPLLIHLNGELLPDGYLITGKFIDRNETERNPPPPKAPDPRIINDFIDTLSPAEVLTL